MKKGNKKSNNNMILFPSDKLIYFLKLAFTCGERQKRNKQVGMKIKNLGVKLK